MTQYKLDSFQGDSDLSYSDNLNPQQLKVVTEASGPALVLAGAGSGKTRVLIYRLAHLLEQGIDTKSILLMTFTNKASGEMRHRAESLLKRNLPDLWSGTFHHIGNKILRLEAETIGFSPNFTIIDREDSKDLLNDCLDDLGLSKNGKLFPKKDLILNIWALSVSSLTKPEIIINQHYEHIKEFAFSIKGVLSLFAKKKKEGNLMDFSDLLLYWYILLQNETMKQKYSSIFQYILVDEYQDTNRIQFEILKTLSSCHNNILAVGDDAQSIYSFRAADINNLLNFPKIFKGASVYKLEINYRSTPQILDLANNIIKQNINQFPKELRAERERGQIPIVAKTKDVYQQAQFIAQRVLELNELGIPLSEIAILFRSRYQAIELEVELLKRNISYVLRGGVRFFEQAHIKDIFSYLKIIVNDRDEISFKRAISIHKGIGRGYAHKIWDKLNRKKESLETIGKNLSTRPKEGFRKFCKIMDSVRSSENPTEAIKSIIDAYKDYCYVSFDNPDDRIKDLEELAKMARTFTTIKNFLLDLNSYEDFKGETLVSTNSKKDLLVLSTIHQAKGLEWDVVFLIGFGDYDFPHPKAIASEKAVEEERRLFYVTVTRAKSHLYITYPQYKYTFRDGLIISRASQFLYELPDYCYEEWDVT